MDHIHTYFPTGLDFCLVYAFHDPDIYQILKFSYKVSLLEFFAENLHFLGQIYNTLGGKTHTQ